MLVLACYTCVTFNYGATSFPDGEEEERGLGTRLLMVLFCKLRGVLNSPANRFSHPLNSINEATYCFNR